LEKNNRVTHIGRNLFGNISPTPLPRGANGAISISLPKVTELAEVEGSVGNTCQHQVGRDVFNSIKNKIMRFNCVTLKNNIDSK